VNEPARATDSPIRRDDLEAKLRELQGGVDETRQAATTTLITVGAVVAVGVVAVAFFLGRRKGKKRTTVVEVRRI
jgi:1-aminocyclopropane-1-carboxylate deaminase/D-cysteine desulfhydrase-like pyridoxal-dependent ACC family enzyme